MIGLSYGHVCLHHTLTHALTRDQVAGTGWLEHVALVLGSSMRIAKALHDTGVPALVHCRWVGSRVRGVSARVRGVSASARGVGARV